jgi:hypothetical protein
VDFLSGQVGFIRMALDADELQNLLIENKIGANRYYKNSSCGTIFRKKRSRNDKKQISFFL